MNTPTLRRLTMQTMANYRSAASQVVAASGAGSRRVVRAVDGTLQRQVMAPATKLVPKAGERMDEMRDNVTRMVERGITQVEKAAEATIERSSDFAMAQAERLADMADGVSLPLVADGLQTAARLTIPAAQLSLGMSEKLVQGAAALADAAGARPVRKAVRKAAGKAARAVKAPVKPAARRAPKAAAPAPKAVKAVKARVAKVVKAAEKAEPAPVKRARRSATRVVETVVDKAAEAVA